MGHKTKAQRIPPTITMPHGVVFDPEKSIAENAAVAWEQSLGVIQTQAERAARMALKKAFGIQECEFTYLEKFPRIPLIEVGEDLIAWDAGDHSLVLVELCHTCASTYRRWHFGSLAGFGEARATRDSEQEPYECQACQYKDALASMSRRGRKVA